MDAALLCESYFSHFLIAFSSQVPVADKLELWRLFVPQLTQTSFLQKQNVAKWFFDICNAEMAQSLSSLQKSEFLKLIILIFHVKKLNN